MENAFNLGDIVYLNSGSPRLTISGITKDMHGELRRVEITWMHNGNIEIAELPIQCVTKTRPTVEIDVPKSINTINEDDY